MPGRAYRTRDLRAWSANPTRLARRLVEEGKLREAARGLYYAALVEKDDWITHALWALREIGLDVWFEGGTSLSNGFGIIERFSEDLDVIVERDPTKRAFVERACVRIAPMFWGPRAPLDEACATLRAWVGTLRA